MPEPDLEGAPEDLHAPPSQNGDSWAAIARDGVDIWLAQGEHWYERSRERNIWKPEDVVGDWTNLVEHLTPLAERSFELTIGALRPWARAIGDRAEP